MRNLRDSMCSAGFCLHEVYRCGGGGSVNQPSNQPAGLTSGQARERQEQFGKNELLQEKKQSVFRVLIAALGEPMFILLMAAARIFNRTGGR